MTTYKHFSLALLAAITAFAYPLVTQAAVYSNGTKVASFDVTLTIVADCTVSTAGALDFGQNHGMLSAVVSSTSNINVTCTDTTPYNLGLSAGSGAGSNGTTRYLSGTGGNTGTVRVNLYQTAGTTLWGNTQGTDTVANVGNGAQVTHTVYGEIPAQSTPAPDSYKSTITATVYF